ncbi:MAG: hypothetical protein ACK5RR_14615, partial [Acidobacteriota bacterium]
SLINNYNLPRTDIFIILATPFEAEKTGAYTLTFNRQTTQMNLLDGPALNQREYLPGGGRGAESFRRAAAAPRPALTRSLVSEP